MMWRAAVAVVCVSWMFASSATALTAVKKNFHQLTTEAELILVGTVIDIDSEKRKAGGIVTRVQFGDVTVVKGTHTAETYTLIMLGGQVGNERMEIPGAPTFTRGEHSIVFIKGNNVNMFPLVGVTQGQFRVRRDPTTNEQIVVDAFGRPVVGVDDNHSVLTERESAALHGAGDSPLSLQEFLDEIAKRIQP